MQREELDYITRCLRWLANAITSEEVEGKLSPLMSEKLGKFLHAAGRDIDFYALTREDFLQLGFMCYGYDEDDPFELWLIPYWMYNLIPDAMQLEDIDHKEFAFKKGVTQRQMFWGCLEYGIKIKNPAYRMDLNEVLLEEEDFD